MKFSRITVQCGIFGAVAFSLGWVVDSSLPATLIVSLIGGLSAVFAQIATRELSSKAQILIDGGIDRFPTDGGERLDDARRTRLRVANLGLATLLTGALAPVAATVRSLFAQPFWSALAWALAAVAIVISTQLFRANLELAVLLENERLRKAEEKKLLETLSKRKSFDPSAFKNDPNFAGFEVRPIAPQR